MTVGATLGSPGNSAVQSRWSILVFLLCFSLVSYFERINLSIVGKFMQADLGLTTIQVGWFFSAFLAGYTLGQIPAGIISDRLGPRLTLSYAAYAWFVLTVVVGLVAFAASLPVFVTFIAILVLRALLGFAEAPTYPAITRSIYSWFPAKMLAFPNALVQSASYSGTAIIAPIIVYLSLTLGWQVAICLVALPALILGLLWQRYGADEPLEAPEGVSRESDAAVEQVGIGLLLRDRNILLISCSYFAHGFVFTLITFWLFIYLVDERGFTLAQSGWITALPSVAGAIAALLGGAASDRAVARLGVLNGRRVIAIGTKVFGGLALIVGAYSNDALIAISAFMLAMAAVGFVESTFWATAINIGGARSGSVSGIMNTFSNLAGVISTSMAPYLVELFGWKMMFTVAASISILGGLLWLGIKRSDFD